MNQTWILSLTEESFLFIRTFNPRNEKNNECNEIDQTKCRINQQCCSNIAIILFEESREKDETIDGQCYPHD